MKKVENEFDDMEIPEGHFNRMAEKLDREFGEEKQVFKLQPWLKFAAAVVILFGFGIFFFNQNETIIHTQQTAAAEEVNEEKNEVEIPMEQATKYYKNSFSKQYKLLAEQTDSPEAKEMIQTSAEMIAELDQEYKELEKHLEKTGDQRVAAAMINNYQKRIKILEDLIQKIKYVNQLKKEQNESVSA